MKHLPWQDDSFFSKNGSFVPFDKLEHAFLGFLGLILLLLIAPLGLGWFGSFVVMNFIGFSWEVKDGYKPYNDLGDIEGFSKKDIIANNIGFLMAFAVWAFFYDFKTLAEPVGLSGL